MKKSAVMQSRRFSIDPWIPFCVVFTFAWIVIPLLMMWVGLKQGYNLEAVTTVSRTTMYALSYASVIVFLVIYAIRGNSFHHAARSGQVWYLEKMVDKGMPIDPKTWLNRTPLHFACKADRRATVIYLLEHGADPQARDLFGSTPRDLAKAESVIEFIDEFQYETQKEPRRISITSDSTLARGHQAYDEKSGLSYEQFRRACARYVRRGLVICGLGIALVFFGIKYISTIRHELSQKYGDSVADEIVPFLPFPAIVVMISGFWWIDRLEKKSGELFCAKCKKNMIKKRQIVFHTKRCPHCGHRVLAD